MQPPLKIEILSPTPFFENLVRISTLPNKNKGLHYGTMISFNKFAKQKLNL